MPALGRPTDGDAQGVGLVLLARILGQKGDDLVEQITRAMAVQRGDRDRVADAQGVELPQVVVLAGRVVELVDEQERGLLELAHHARHALVLLGDAHRAVDDEQDDGGLLGRRERLVADGGGEHVVALHGLDAAGVDERELATVPVGHVVAAVAGDAAALVHDGVGGLGDTIDERRLAHVRAADDRYDGSRHTYSLSSHNCKNFTMRSHALAVRPRTSVCWAQPRNPPSRGPGMSSGARTVLLARRPHKGPSVRAELAADDMPGPEHARAHACATRFLSPKHSGAASTERQATCKGESLRFAAAKTSPSTGHRGAGTGRGSNSGRWRRDARAPR